MNKAARIPLITLLVIAVLLLLVHLALPPLVRHFLNQKLADMGDYSGHVEDVDIAWWRGAYSLNGLIIEKTDDDVQAPFLKLPETEIGIHWRTLLNDHALVAELTFNDPELNFVDTPGKEDQDGEGVGWRDKVREIMPITLQEVRVNNGAIHFRNFTSEPPVDVYANAINMTIHGLSNTAEQAGPQRATLEGDAKFLNHAPLTVSATLDPLLELENFELQLKVLGVELTRLNDLARAYGNFDFKSGTGDLVIEASAKNSQVDGYIKPLLHNAEVFDWEQDVEDSEKGFWRGVWEGVVGAAEDLLKNKEENQSATRVELSGNLKDADVSPFQAFIAVLRNGFIQAFKPQFDRAAENAGG